MKFSGSIFLNYNAKERQTITITSGLAGLVSDGTIIKGTPAAPTICSTFSDLDDTVLGVVKVDPDGVQLTTGEKFDLSCGTIRIDVQSYELSRLNETSSTKCNLSTVTDNVVFTGSGCVLELVNVCK